MQNSSYVFYSVNELSIHFHTLDLSRTGTYVPSPKWLLDKKATVNPNNPNDNYCSAYAATIAIYHRELGSRLDRISSKLIEYTSKFDWNSIKFLDDSTDYKRFERNNDEVALNIFFVPFNQQDIKPEYVSKHNFNEKVQISLLKITNGEGKWHFLTLQIIVII